MEHRSRNSDLLGDGAGESRQAVKADFRCDVCKDIAATIYYIPKGVAHPLAEFLSQECDRLVIDGFLGKVAGVVSNGADNVRKAVQSSDPDALWRINLLWAPFYCHVCRKSYCQKHWTTETVFADDFPGWYEHTSGQCPNGHTRLLDD